MYRFSTETSVAPDVSNVTIEVVIKRYSSPISNAFLKYDLEVISLTIKIKEIVDFQNEENLVKYCIEADNTRCKKS